MSSVQPSPEHLSLILSEVLDDIGLNDEMIQRRRQSALYEEFVLTIYQGLDKNSPITNVYEFGSQSEGTTTIGLDSDGDILLCKKGFNVINDWSYWKHGAKNLLMVQDETTAPGYCLLQLLRDDVPLAAEHIPDNNYCKDNKGRILKKHLDNDDILPDGAIQHGPALTMPASGSSRETDRVLAFHCTQWPEEARRWLVQRNVGGWPNASLKSECENSGFFLVPVDSKISGHVGVEWRISTTLAERHLMFSLNNTHIKCYTMMKVILKSYDEFKDVISSYMCKTALLHCVENTMADYWQDRNLITCLVKVLCVLYNFIAHIKCPHFIVHGNNLMAGKISPFQQQRLLQVLERIIRSEGRMVQDIRIDDIGERVKQKLNNYLLHLPALRSRLQIHRLVSGQLAYSSACSVITLYRQYMIDFRNQRNEHGIKQMVCQYMHIRNLYPQLNYIQKNAVSNILSIMSQTIGSLMASHSISLHGHLTNSTIEWLKSGLNSDVSSGLLKLATVYYRTGNMRVTEEILTRIDQIYDREVVIPLCVCVGDKPRLSKEGFVNAVYHRQGTDFRHIVSNCVGFVYRELTIVPQELRQEFFRSSQGEVQRRRLYYDRWMDDAVVDSLPYLYFLQYKVYSTLRKNEEKQGALNKLKNVFNEEPGLLHKETVYNLLGQCMEQENQPDEAFHYYEQSLIVRSQHNAANIHKARLLSI